MSSLSSNEASSSEGPPPNDNTTSEGNAGLGNPRDSCNNNSGVVAGNDANIGNMNNNSATVNQSPTQTITNNINVGLKEVFDKVYEMQKLQFDFLEKKKLVADDEMRTKYVKSSYEIKIEELKKEVIALEAKLSEEISRGKKYERESERKCKELEDEIESKRRSLMNHQDRVEKLETEISELQRQLSGEVGRKAALEDVALRRREELEKVLEEKRQMLQRERNEAENLEKEIRSLDSRLSEEIHRRNESEAEVSRLRQELEALVEQRDSFLSLQQRYECTLEEQKKEISVLKSKLEEEIHCKTETEVKNRQEYQELEKEISTLRFQLQEERRGVETEEGAKREDQFRALITNMQEQRRKIREKLIEEDKQKVGTSLSRNNCAPRRPDAVILVMGNTRTGKSSLIRQITRDSKIKIRHSAEDEKSKIGLAHFFEPDGRWITLIDTPGYEKSCHEVTINGTLRQIAAFLENEYKDGKATINGILYLHRITHPKLRVRDIGNLEMFQSLCGSDAMKNVTVVTTKWDKVEEEEGAKRERDLMTNQDSFGPLISAGARFLRHNNSHDAALRIVQQSIHNRPTTLQIQLELASGTKLEDTKAGLMLRSIMDISFMLGKGMLEAVREKIEYPISHGNDDLMMELEKLGEAANLMLEIANMEMRQLKDGLSDFDRLVAKKMMEIAARQHEEKQRAFLESAVRK